jgi:hypothetical protein
MKTIIDLGSASLETKQTVPNSQHLDGQKIVEGSLKYRAAELSDSPDFVKVEDPI